MNNIRLTFFIIILSVFIQADTIAKQIKKVSPERGIHFGEMDISDKHKDDEATLKKLLKKVTEGVGYLKEIRDIIKEKTNPSPKIITINGKECIENSSADCYKHPVIPEIANVPAIANALRDPTPENIKIKNDWINKWRNQAFKYGIASYIDELQRGINNPYTGNNIGNNLSGTDSRIKNNLNSKKREIKKHSKNINIIVTLGTTIAPEISSLERLFSNIINLQSLKLKVNVLFHSKEYKDFFNEYIVSTKNIRIIQKWNNISKTAKIVANSELYKQINPKITPSYLMNYKKDWTLIFAKGYDAEDKLFNGLYNILVNKNVITYKDNENFSTDNENLEKIIKNIKNEQQLKILNELKGLRYE